MGKFRGSETERNLLTAFAGESQARNRYTYFAEQARQDGLIQIADIFSETAKHEREHAKRFFKFLINVRDFKGTGFGTGATANA